MHHFTFDNVEVRGPFNGMYLAMLTIMPRGLGPYGDKEKILIEGRTIVYQGSGPTIQEAKKTCIQGLLEDIKDLMKTVE
jgi:hypothetical protein